MKALNTHSLYAWYLAYRKRDNNRAVDALWHARANHKAEHEAVAVLARLSPNSRERIEAFVHDFIRGELVEQITSDRDQDFINESDRASRCYDAAESGADGKTHAEVIQDWVDAFDQWLSNEHRDYWQGQELFATAVRARFTLTEIWHAFNGSLDQEIG